MDLTQVQTMFHSKECRMEGGQGEELESVLLGQTLKLYFQFPEQTQIDFQTGRAQEHKTMITWSYLSYASKNKQISKSISKPRRRRGQWGPG